MKSTYIEGGCSPEKVKVKDMAAGDLFMSFGGRHVLMKLPGSATAPVSAIVVYAKYPDQYPQFNYGSVINYADDEERYLLPKGHGIKLVRE